MQAENNGLLSALTLLNKVKSMSLESKSIYLSSPIPGFSQSFQFNPFQISGGRWFLGLAGSLFHVPNLPLSESDSLKFMVVLNSGEAVKIPVELTTPVLNRDNNLSPCFLKIPENTELKIVAYYSENLVPSQVEIKLTFFKG